MQCLFHLMLSAPSCSGTGYTFKPNPGKNGICYFLKKYWSQKNEPYSTSASTCQGQGKNSLI